MTMMVTRLDGAGGPGAGPREALVDAEDAGAAIGMGAEHAGTAMRAGAEHARLAATAREGGRRREEQPGRHEPCHDRPFHLRSSFV
jgi:hypothetical protein